MNITNPRWHVVVVVEPVLTEEKLRSLLAEGHEQPALDYKKQLDLRERRDVVELAKDVGAMQNEKAGGYIVIGADDQGKVTPSVTAEQAKLFDEATLRNKLKRYLNEPFDTRVAIQKVEDCTVVLVYIAPNPEGWSIFKANGEYEHEASPGSGKMEKKIVFRVGEVFVRHGTASERWQDADKKRLIEKVIAQKREEWRTELRAELAYSGLSSQQIERMPSSAVAWQLDAELFDELATELMRRNDDIPLCKMIMRARVDASPLLSSDLGELSTLLDRITSLAALALTYERQQWFMKALDALVRIYELGFDASGYQRSNVPTVKMWLYVIARIYALGARI
jgi:RNase P protein component